MEQNDITNIDIFKIDEYNKKLSEEQKRKRARDLEDIKKLLTLPEGRRFIWRRLEICGIFRSSFATHSNLMSLNEGRREAGLELLRDILEADHSAYSKMQNEYMSALMSKKKEE